MQRLVDNTKLPVVVALQERKQEVTLVFLPFSSLDYHPGSTTLVSIRLSSVTVLSTHLPSLMASSTASTCLHCKPQKINNRVRKGKEKKEEKKRGISSEMVATGKTERLTINCSSISNTANVNAEQLQNALARFQLESSKEPLYI